MKDAGVNPNREGVCRATGSTATSVLVKAKAGNAFGWRRLVALYGPLIYRWGRRSGLDEHAAADVVQEVFQTVHRKIADFHRDRPGDTFRGWLNRITQNKVSDKRRRAAREPDAVGGSLAHKQLQQVLDHPTVECSDSESEDGDEVGWLYRRAMDFVQHEFEPATWQAFWQVTVDDRKPADVAADLGLSRNAVYVAKSRVLSRLRAEFAEVIE